MLVTRGAEQRLRWPPKQEKTHPRSTHGKPHCAHSNNAASFRCALGPKCQARTVGHSRAFHYSFLFTAHFVLLVLFFFFRFFLSFLLSFSFFKTFFKKNFFKIFFKKLLARFFALKEYGLAQKEEKKKLKKRKKVKKKEGKSPGRSRPRNKKGG